MFRAATVLLVEDEPLMADSQRTLLTGCGYRVVVAHTGEDAFAQVRERPDIDLVLMDINLGLGWDGTEAAQAILAVRRLPIVFLSSHTEPDIVAKTERITSYGYVVKDSNPTVLDASIKMAFKLFEARQALEETEARQHTLLEQIPEVIAIINTFENVTYMSPNYSLWFGWSWEGHEVSTHWDRIHPDDRAECRTVLRELASGEVAVRTGRFRYRCPDSTYRTVEYRATDRTKDPLIDGVLLTFHDVSSTQALEETLVREQSLLRTLIASSPDPIFAKDLSGRYWAINDAGARKNGYEVAQMIGKTNFDLLPLEKALEYQKTDEYVLATGESVEAPERLVTPEGERYVSIRKSLWKDEAGRKLGVIGVSNDVTGWVLSQRRVEGLLAEKELVLREVHHRIKNNMATVAGFLILQAAESQDPTVVSALESARSRINAMMVLYDRLYRKDDFSQVSSKEYLGALIEQIVEGFAGLPVTIETQIADIALSLPVVQTVGIIVNELVTNALKYALTASVGTRVVVAAQALDQWIAVIVHDNGPGIKPGDGGEQGFGLRLVSLLAESLGGSVQFEAEAGTKVTLRFPTSGSV